LYTQDAAIGGEVCLKYLSYKAIISKLRQEVLISNAAANFSLSDFFQCFQTQAEACGYKDGTFAKTLYLIECSRECDCGGYPSFPSIPFDKFLKSCVYK